MQTLDVAVKDFQAARFAWLAGGKQVMSTSYVDNVCHCAILAAERSPGGRAYLVADGEDRTLREIIGQLVATRGVEAKARDVPVGVAWFLATLMEAVWRTLRLSGSPLLTRQQMRMVGYTFTLRDRFFREPIAKSMQRLFNSIGQFRSFAIAVQSSTIAVLAIATVTPAPESRRQPAWLKPMQAGARISSL